MDPYPLVALDWRSEALVKGAGCRDLLLTVSLHNPQAVFSAHSSAAHSPVLTVPLLEHARPASALPMLSSALYFLVLVHVYSCECLSTFCSNECVQAT